MPVDIEDVMTFKDDRLFRPESLTAKIYEDAIIRCSNKACKLEFSIDEINTHEFCECLYRIIKCPAKGFDYRIDPNQVHKHAFQCPFLHFYCAMCYGAYSAEVLEHSCAIMLKRRMLVSASFAHAGV